MSRAYRCEMCDGTPDSDQFAFWRIERHGDTAVTWSCMEHLNRVCLRLIRSWEAVTELSVKWRGP